MPIDKTTDGVAADMERIFEPLAGRAVVPAFNHDKGDRRAQAGRGWQRVTLAAPALVLLVTAGLTIGYVFTGGPASHVPKSAIAARPTPTPVRSAPASPLIRTLATSLPLPTPSTTTAMSSSSVVAVARAPATDPRRVTAATLPDRIPNPADAPTARVPAARPVMADRASRQEQRAQPAGTSAAAPVQPVRERANPSRTVSPCVPGSLEDRCIYQEVLQADTRLRLVYDRAKRDGVSNFWLSAITRRWIRAREDAEHDPDGTIRRYERLADVLDEQRRRVAQ